MVFSWSSFRTWWVLCALRRKRLLQASVLFIWSVGCSGEWPTDSRSNVNALLLRVLCQPRSWEQVSRFWFRYRITKIQDKARIAQRGIVWPSYILQLHLESKSFTRLVYHQLGPNRYPKSGDIVTKRGKYIDGISWKNIFSSSIIITVYLNSIH